MAPKVSASLPEGIFFDRRVMGTLFDRDGVRRASIDPGNFGFDFLPLDIGMALTGSLIDFR